ncbi:hypothetical protein ABZ260_12005 [Streptosporangium sp. NPDC006013]|uniref:helix-turn-helix domain-containing protein n=1 Tax=Streptosporangium sp. NPDC006013 TaxID=3155596 RepID=UPI0033BDC04F
MMSEFSKLARQMWHQIEPVHASLYFSPEAFDEAARLGYDIESRWPSYFAWRTAPLGAAGPKLAAPEASAALAKESGFFSARTDVTVPGTSPVVQEFAKSLEYAFPGDTHPMARQVMALIAPEIQAALLGQKDAKTALEDAAKEANALLANGG